MNDLNPQKTTYMKKKLIASGIIVAGLAAVNVLLFGSPTQSKTDVFSQNVEALSASALETGCDGETESECVIEHTSPGSKPIQFIGKGNPWAKF